MKKILLLFVLVLMGLSLMAKPVEPEKAAQVAKNFVAQYVKGADQYSAEVVYTHLMLKSKQPAMYVVNVGNMFVLVSADDVAHPVLGYSLSRPWPVQMEMRNENSTGEVVKLPSQITSYLDDLAGQIEAASGVDPDQETIAEWQQLLTVNYQLSTTNLPDSVGPLLTTTWNQSPYYNALCPEDANGQAVTGCVATAMAQIINYWGYPVHGRGTHSYSSNYGILSVNYDSATYDYANMPDALTSTSTPVQVNAVATLMRDCGVAVNMDYSAGESGAFDQETRAALINFFRFSPNLSFAEKAYFSNAEWSTLLRDNIGANHPVYYSGRGTGGHAFVCDGYKTDDYFHFNFGWGGYANGWYLTSAVNPAGMDFNSDQSIIVGIVPDSAGNVILGQMAGNSTFTVDEPLEFYHLMGHNAYTGTSYSNSCSNNVLFTSSDPTKQLVLDIISFEDQNITVYDGHGGNTLTTLEGGEVNDLSPVVSTTHSLNVAYQGYLYYLGFRLNISQDNGCRMVSNIVASVDTTTVHLSWTENGSATQWQIEYGEKGFALGDGITVVTNDTTNSVGGLTKFVTYDFYIRPICGGSWFGPITVLALPPYWIDVVTTQPAGYSVDSEGNVIISSAEGLAWWAKIADNEHRYWRWLVYQEPFVPTIEGLDESMMQNGWCWNRPTIITTDIDLDGYRWKPVTFSADIDGQMHTISNMHIYEDTSLEPEPYYGFLSSFSGPSQIGYTIKDMVFQNPVINCPTGYYGVLAGGLSEARIRNVGVNNAVIYQYSSSPFISMYNVYGVAGGGLIGRAELTSIDNCYSTGTIVSKYPYQNVNNGGIVGYVENLSSINNCYSSVQIQSRTGGVGSICAFANGLEMKNCYGIDDYPILDHNDLSNGGIVDTLRFDKNTQQLDGSVFFDDINCNTLLEALNQRVSYENNESWMTWMEDDNGNNDSFPVFSEPFIVTCPNAENIVAQNVIINSNNALLLQWDDSDGVSQWRIKCVEKDAPENTAQYYVTDSNSIIITDMEIGKMYRIYVKPICDDTNQGGWGTGIQHVYDKPYWTDFVTTQPDGYVIDDDGNVTIQSRDGFVWLSCLVNGLHGQEAHNFRNKSVKLMVDVDLSDYRWMPIGNTWWNTFDGSFDGNNHTISNLYVNEYHDWVGLFGHVYQSKFVNITINNSFVKGFSNVGTICGMYQNVGYDWNYGDVLFDNCRVNNASVYGDNLVGGIGGRIENWGDETGLTIVVRNCFSSGEVHGSNHVGGLIGNIKDLANISNCYSACDIFATEMDAGGLIGFTKSCVLENSYATGIITSTGGSYAKLVGYLCENVTCHYMYGLEDENPINLFGYVGANCTIDNSEWFTSVGALENAVTIGGVSYSDLLSALNAWVDANDTVDIYRHWAADSVNVNGGFPVFAAIPCTPTTGSDSITVCDSYTWHGNSYTVSMELVDTLSTMDGCDSIVTHHLTVNYSTTGIDSVTAYDSYTWIDGITYTESNFNSQFSIPNSQGCDSVITLNLTVIPFDTVTIAVNNELLGSVALVGTLPEGATDLGDGSYRVPRGSVMTVRALFDTADFHFLYWICGTDTVSTDTIYTFTVTGSAEYMAHIEYLPCPYVYVSKTGFVIWEKPHTSPVAYAKIDVKADTSDAWTTIGYIASKNYIQVPTWLLTDSTLYNVSIILFNNSPFYEAPAVTLDWFYVACEHLESVSDFTGEVSDQGVALSWSAGEGPQQYRLYRDNVLVGTFNSTSYFDTLGTYSTAYTLNRVYGGSAVCPYNNDSLSMGCEQSPTLYVNFTLGDEPAICGTAEYILPDTTGHFAVGDTCTVRAVARESYIFTHWTLNGVTVSTDSLYTFKVGTGGDLVAHYEYIPASDLYVSRTGWATWNNPHSQPGDVSCASTQVSVKSLDGQLLSTHTFTQPSILNYQLSTLNLTDTTLYLMSVVLTDTAGISSETTTEWYYMDCGRLSGFDTISGVFSQQGVTFSWNYPTNITQPPLLYDWNFLNGFVTDSGAMANGADASWLKTRQTTNGPNLNRNSDYWVGDSVNLEFTTLINEIEVYGYQTGSDTTSTFTGLYIQIYNGNPMYGGTLVWGNADSNLMTSTAFVNCYRGSNGSVNATTRPIMSVTASNLDIQLAPGDYFVVWSMTGSLSSGPWAAPHAVPVLGHIGQGIQKSSGEWNYLKDTYSRKTYGLAMRLTGDFIIPDVGAPLAAVVMRDGEVLDTTSATTYTDASGSPANNYELRVAYGGNRYCPFDNAYMSMSCPQPVTLHCGDTLTSSYSAVACESYLWHGAAYTASGIYHDTLSSFLGCDSIVTLNLTVNNPVHTATTETACESYTWNGTSYTATGDYTYTHTDANNCTQVDTLHLTINTPVHTAITETACETFTWIGTTYTATGDYTYSHLDANNCTQVDTLHLTINTPVHTAITETACETFTWNGTTYTTTGNYTYSHLDANGCTQVDTLHLTINTPVHTATTETACETFTWNGITYTTSGDYTYSHLDANGCTQVDTLHLTINNPVNTVTTETACDSYTWQGIDYTASGDYTYSHLDANGCTQVDTLHLTINNSVSITIVDTADGIYTWNGETYTESGTYTWQGTTVEGCDSTVVLTLVINPVGIDLINDNQVSVYPNPTAGIIVVEAQNVQLIEVYDQSGRKVTTYDRTNRIDLGGLPSGSYILKIHIPDSVSVHRVVLK